MESNEKINEPGLLKRKQTFYILMSEDLCMARNNTASEGEKSDLGSFLDGF